MADSVQYLIDIAAEMSGGDSTIEQLTQIADRLSGSETALGQFDAAIARTKTALASAASASEEASTALAAGEQRYAQLERAAVRAATALERAGQKTSGSVPADLAQKATAAAAALKTEGAALDALRTKATAAAAAHTQLGGTLKNLEAGAKAASKAQEAAAQAARGTGDLGKLKGALGDLGGPLGMLGQKATSAVDAFGDLTGAIGTGPGALVAVAVVAATAVVALTVAIGAAIVKTALWAIGLADAARSSALTTAALEQTHEALAGLGTIMPAVQRATGLATDDLRDLAKQLAASKVSADDMPAALRAVAMAEAALGKGGAAKFIADLQSGKKSVAELSREIETKFGGIVSKKLLSLDSQTETLKRNLGETFGGLKIEPLLGELNRLVKLFDATSVSGRTMKFLFEKMFQPLIDAAVAAGPVIERFFLGAQIGALKLYIRFQPAIKAIKALLGEDDSTTIDTLKAAELAGKAFAAAIATAVIGVGLVVAALALPIIAFHKLQAVGEEVFGRLYNSAASVLEFIGSISLSEIGSQMVSGLAAGISGAGNKVTTALGTVVDDAIAAAKRKLGIASPSKVFEAMGTNVGEGFTGGVEAENDNAKSALETLVEPPAAKAGGGASVSASSGGNTYNFYINARSGEAEDIAEAVREVIVEINEGTVQQLGAQPPAESAA